MVSFGHEASSVGPSTYPYKQGDLSLSVTFGKRPSYVWLPVHEQSHSIVAVGRYRLPKPMVIPRGITPLPSALMVSVPDSPKNASVTVFFDPKLEDAVYHWAKSFFVVDKSPEAQTQLSEHCFWTRNANDPNRISSSDKTLPITPPLAWSANGTVPERVGRFDLGFKGVNVITTNDLSSNISAQFLLSVGAADYVGGSDDFGPNSPLKGERRHVSFSIDLPNQH